MHEPTLKDLGRLECVERGRVSRDDECGWTPLTVDDEVAVYCAECDKREFARPSRRWNPDR